MTDKRLTPERIAKLHSYLEDALTHSGRVEEDELYETGLALICKVCPIGGRVGTGPLCPNIDHCDEQCRQDVHEMELEGDEAPELTEQFFSEAVLTKPGESLIEAVVKLDYVTNPAIAKKRRMARSKYLYMREAITALCGGRKPPLEMVEAYYTTDDERLQSWCFEKRSCDWMTGIGIVEAARGLFEESENNGNVWGKSSEEDVEAFTTALEPGIDHSKCLGTYHGRCPRCPGKDGDPAWLILRHGDAVISWACHAHLADELGALFNRPDRAFTVTPINVKPHYVYHRSDPTLLVNILGDK